MYSDYLEPYIAESSYGTSQIDYYNDQKPNNGKYCLYWTGGDQYSVVGMDFVPDKDLSLLKNQDYALDMFVRGDTPGTAFDVRFIDTKTGPDDHPWRMKTTINDALVPWDNRWHHVHIPLKNFVEGGSWDNNTWYNPEGKFDWTAVDRFEIDAEYFGMTGRKLWFDNIQITNLDTATVIDTTVLAIRPITAGRNGLDLKVFPNPMKNYTEIQYKAVRGQKVFLMISDLQGREMVRLENLNPAPGIQSIMWNGATETGAQAPPGIYICRILSGSSADMAKIIKL